MKDGSGDLLGLIVFDLENFEEPKFSGICAEYICRSLSQASTILKCIKPLLKQNVIRNDSVFYGMAICI